MENFVFTPANSEHIYSELERIYRKIGGTRSVYTNHHDFIRQDYDMSRSEVAQTETHPIDLYICAILMVLYDMPKWIELEEDEFSLIKSLYGRAIDHRSNFN